MRRASNTVANLMGTDRDAAVAMYINNATPIQIPTQDVYNTLASINEAALENAAGMSAPSANPTNPAN